MNRAVAILPNGSVIKGAYDGYGRLDDVNAEETREWKNGCVSFNGPLYYHEACWVVMGEPTEYTGKALRRRIKGTSTTRVTM